ncbi:hypothetical protein [Parasegetibacter sp. NRK P23]|uniref:hypothetical protein n=1 Tax=Parasegetibacter sp. NRK P23 TaxID=2942999 RepID=UPI002043C2C7|nr:hypothetical protein [Parasegetibacter sp. NRK P23]MCM5528305.1 hypothetical protein [Parasegetibacter sp. NRK P23]
MRSLIVLLLLIGVYPAKAQQLFPDRCIGVWNGMMHIYSKGIKKDSVMVVFEVHKQNDTTWGWKTKYVSEKSPMVKDYTLRQSNNQYEFITDEGQNIQLQEYVYGNKMYSQFETGNILLTSSYELVNPGELLFEVTAASRSPQNETSELQNYTVVSLQRVLLIKQ